MKTDKENEEAYMAYVWSKIFDPRGNVIDLSEIKWERALRGSGLMQLASGAWVDPKTRGYK